MVSHVCLRAVSLSCNAEYTAACFKAHKLYAGKASICKSTGGRGEFLESGVQKNLVSMNIRQLLEAQKKPAFANSDAFPELESQGKSMHMHS